MRIDVITVLPQMFPGVLGLSILGRAAASGALDVHVHDLREWTTDRHRTTDDYPFGGGPGMVMKPEPVFSAVEAVVALDPQPPHTVLICPQGRPLDQARVAVLAAMPRLVLITGRYEGFDERIRTLADEEISIGDYVLTGGELPALVLIDAVARLLPGVLGGEGSAEDESFVSGLLEYPQYTRPAEFRDMHVPDVLLSGDHARIAAWRREQAIQRTAERRPDLIDGAELTADERDRARTLVNERENDDLD
mgnify:CR=1 FL=1